MLDLLEKDSLTYLHLIPLALKILHDGTFGEKTLYSSSFPTQLGGYNSFHSCISIIWDDIHKDVLQPSLDLALLHFKLWSFI